MEQRTLTVQKLLEHFTKKNYKRQIKQSLELKNDEKSDKLYMKIKKIDEEDIII